MRSNCDQILLYLTRQTTHNLVKKTDIASKPCDANGVCGVLGALGSRFESCRPDSNNPSHRLVSQPVFFIGWNMTYLYLCHIYVICPSLLSYSQIFLVLQYIFSRINIFKDRLIKFMVRLCEGFGAAFPLFFCLLLIYGEI